MQEREKVRQLFERYRQGQCTPEEEARLHAWFNRYAGEEAGGLDDLREKYDVNGSAGEKLWQRWLPYAAILAVALTMTWYFWDNRGLGQLAVGTVVQTEDIAPGGNRATLTLADGRTIDLSEAQSGIVVADKRIVYEDESEALLDFEAEKTIPLILSTPKGGTYQITLSDGTKVWLNAASTLKYPSHFSHDERVVEIEGEGYFAVAKDPSRPFKVASGNQRIEVLGTEFNVSAYNDEKDVKTTLVEGSVQLQVDASSEQMSLVPGEQSLLSGTSLRKREVDVTPYVAWKDGVFNFDNTTLSDMMKQMSRWYGVEVIYESDVPNERFSGVMSRDVTLQTVLELLSISEITFRIQGNQLIVE